MPAHGRLTTGYSRMSPVPERLGTVPDVLANREIWDTPPFTVPDVLANREIWDTPPFYNDKNKYYNLCKRDLHAQNQLIPRKSYRITSYRDMKFFKIFFENQSK